MKINLVYLFVFFILSGCSNPTTNNLNNLNNLDLKFKLGSYKRIITDLSKEIELDRHQRYILSFSFYKLKSYQRANYILRMNSLLDNEDNYLLALIYYAENKYEDALFVLDKTKKKEISTEHPDNLFLGKVDNLVGIIDCDKNGYKSCMKIFNSITKEYPLSELIYNNYLLINFILHPDEPQNILKLYDAYKVTNANFNDVVIAAIISKNNEMAIELLSEKYGEKYKAMEVYKGLKDVLLSE